MEQNDGYLHPKTIKIRSDFLSKLLQKRKYPEAERLCRHLLEALEERYGKGSIESVAGLKLLKRYYSCRSIYYKAEEYCRKALAIIGPEHTDYEEFNAVLADIYRRTGRFEAAEVIYKHVLSLKTERPVADDLDEYMFSLVEWLYIMAEFFGETRQFEKAEQCLLQAMETLRNNPFYITPDTSYVMLALTDLYTAQGQYRKAEFLAKRAEKKLRPLRRSLVGISRLPFIYALQGRYEKAERILMHFIDRNSKLEWIIGALIKLAAIHILQGKDDEADDEISRILNFSQPLDGPIDGREMPIVGLNKIWHFSYDHRTIDKFRSNFTSLEDLAALLTVKKEKLQAEFMYTFMLALNEALTGLYLSSGLYNIRSLDNLARFYQMNNDYNVSIIFLKEKKKILEHSYGCSHPRIRRVKNNIELLKVGIPALEPIVFPVSRFSCEINVWEYTKAGFQKFWNIPEKEQEEKNGQEENTTV